jgi:hypothetical protein
MQYIVRTKMGTGSMPREPGDVEIEVAMRDTGGDYHRLFPVQRVSENE